MLGGWIARMSLFCAGLVFWVFLKGGRWVRSFCFLFNGLLNLFARLEKFIKVVFLDCFLIF